MDSNIKYMCFLYIFIVVFMFFSEAIDQSDPHASTRKKCSGEFKLTDEILKLGEQDPSDFSCYLFCLFKDINIMNQKGEFDPNLAAQEVQDNLREAARKYIFMCYDLVKPNMTSDGCKNALEMVQCFKEKAPEMYEMLGLFHPPSNEPLKMTQ
uniref:Odorant-binding protein 8 n=1 Tax=Microplitis mediator TaxID=375433 RepID=I1SV20_9HYME|nr:odorant-binding protein 8 [Microplitis mediator]